MAFSIKNIFQKGGGAESHSVSAPEGGGFFGTNGAALASSPFSAVPQGGDTGHGAQGPGFGGTLFRTVGPENLDGAPVTPGNGGSPFAPYASPDRTTLTAGDFLPHLPADVVRANGVMPDQPVSVSAQALETAISSGQLAVPLFEIYHVCPALFRVPVSPHDTRMVPLPKSKLPSMIASHTSALKPPSGPANMQTGSSPFGMGMPGSQPGNPFAPALPELPPQTGPMGGTRPAGTLPPRRPPGTAPAIPTQADFIGQNSLSLPGQQAPEAMPASRSLFQPAVAEPPPMPGASAASPFGAMPAQQAPFQPAAGATSLLFGLGKPPSDPELGGAGGTGPLQPHNAQSEQPSPFASMQAPAAGSPFQGMPGASMQGSPFQMPPEAGAAPGGSPFGSAMPAQPMQAAGSPFAAMPGAGASPFASAAPSQGAGAMPFMPAGDSGSPFHPATSASPVPLVQPLPFTPFGPAPAQTENGSPFAMPAPGYGEQGAAPSPFASAAPQVASFEVQSRPVTPEPPKLGNLPFSAQQSRPTIKIQPQASPHGMPPMPHAGGGEETMEVSLAAVLKGQTAQDLGFDPNFIPGWITTKLPAADVREQLGSGQVALSLGLIIDGTDHSFRSVISHGRRDFTVKVSAAEVFQTMAPASSTPSLTPSPSGPAAPAAYSQSQPPFQPQSPFQPPAAAAAPFQPQSLPVFPQSGSGGPNATPTGMGAHFQAPLQTPPQPAPQSDMAPAAKSFDPFASGAGDWGGKAGSPLFAPAPEISKPEGLSSDQLFAGKSEPAPAAPIFSPAPEKAPNSFFADPAPARPAPAIPHVTRDEGRAASVPLGRPAAESVFQPAPAASVSPGASMPGLSLSAAGNNEQLILRALLGVSDKLNRQMVLEHTARLPGVSACAWVKGGKVTAHGDNSKAAQDFRQQAADIASSMRTLARLTGLEAETLSIAVGDRLLTFCLQQDQSFGVLHTSMEPPSGLREKITLLSRELAQMTGD